MYVKQEEADSYLEVFSHKTLPWKHQLGSTFPFASFWHSQLLMLGKNPSDLVKIILVSKMAVELIHWNQLLTRASTTDYNSNNSKSCQVTWRLIKTWVFLKYCLYANLNLTEILYFHSSFLMALAILTPAFVSVFHLFGTEFERSSTYLRTFKFMEWVVFFAAVDELLCAYSV